MTHRSLRSITTALLLGASLALTASAQSVPSMDPARKNATRERILRHLQPDSDVFSFTVFGDGLEQKLKALTEQMGAAATDPGDARFKQDYAALARTLGLTQLNGIGYSSTPSGEGFENRVFLSIDGPRVGLWTLVGGAPHTFDTARYAPADTDVFMEGDLDVENAVKSVLKVVAQVSPEAAAEFAVEKLADSDSSGALKTLLSLKGRLTVVVRAGYFLPTTEHPVEAGERPLAGFVRMEGIGNAVRARLARSKLEPKKAGAIEYYSSEDSGAGTVPFAPVIAIDGNTAYAALDRVFLEECLARTPAESLATQAAFSEALQELGGTGNSVSYFSPGFFRFVHSALVDLRANPIYRLSAQNKTGLIDYVLEQLPRPTQPVVAVSSNLPDGILSRSWSPKSLSTQQFALNLLNPELFGDLVSAAVVTAFAETRHKREESRRSAQIEANLKRIHDSAAAYFAADPEATEVTFTQLLEKHPELEGLQAVSGESYAELTVQKASDLIEIATADYNVVKSVRPLTTDEQAKIQANLALFDEAAALYFAKNPDASGMGAYDANDFIRQIPNELPSVVGESYHGLQVAKEDTEIAVATPGEQRVALTRDPAARWKALKRAVVKEQELLSLLQPGFEASRTYFTRSAVPSEADAATETPTTVTLAALVADGLVELPPGLEQGDAETIVYHAKSYEVTGYRSGQELKVLMPLERARQEAIAANLKTVGKALRGHLTKNPKEPLVFAGEIVGTSKSLTALPSPVAGEDYALASLRRGEEVVTLTLPSGHVLTAPLVP